MRRLVAKLIVALMATVLPLVGVAAPAHADTTGDTFVAKINELRASKGLPPVQVDAELSAFAQAWTDSMAATDVLSHNPKLASSPGSWTKAGENVGVGGEVNSLFDAFVASPHHYENLVDPAFNLVGVGVTVVNGKLWTTHDFEARPATRASTPATTTPARVARAAVTPTTAPARRAPAAPATTAPPTTVPPAPVKLPPPVPVPVVAAAPAPHPPVVPARIRLSLEQSRGLDPIF